MRSDEYASWGAEALDELSRPDASKAVPKP